MKDSIIILRINTGSNIHGRESSMCFILIYLNIILSATMGGAFFEAFVSCSGRLQGRESKAICINVLFYLLLNYDSRRDF